MPAVHHYVYTADSPIQVGDLHAVEVAPEFTITVLTKNERVPINKKFIVEVGLPLIVPQNLVPKNRQKPFRMPVQLLLVDIATPFPAALPFDAKIYVGAAMNAPRRRTRVGRRMNTQLFRFAPIAAFTNTPVVLWARSLHKYFDEIGPPDGALFPLRRTIGKDVEVPTT